MRRCGPARPRSSPTSSPAAGDRRDADRRGQVALLPAAGDRARRARRRHARRLAADRADEGSGRRAARARHPGGRADVGARAPTSSARSSTVSAPAHVHARLRRARAVSQPALRRRAARDRRQASRWSRSTRRTASRSGGTTSARTTGGSARSSPSSSRRGSPRSPRPRRPRSAATSRRSSASTTSRLHVRGFDRPNLHYSVAQGRAAPTTSSSKLVELVRMREGGVALVYAATRKNAEAVRARRSSQAGMRSRVYHAGLEDEVREKAQDVFMAGELDVIVATNAFGMGVDKSDIRLVVHADIPRSPEAYYQEAGRGGRDGKPTRCVLLFNHGDIRLQEFLIDASFPVGRAAARPVEAAARPARARQAARATTTISRRASSRTCRAAPSSAATVGRRSGSSSATACSRATTSGSPPTRPQPGMYPPLDVESLQRRADVERSKLRTMIDYAYYPRCRRQYVLEYFGDADWSDRAIARAARATTAMRSRTARRPGLSDDEVDAIRSAAHAGRLAATAGSAARGSRRSRTAPTTTRGSTRCRSAAACAAGRRSRSWICCVRSKAPGSSRRRAASTRRSRRRARAIMVGIGKLDPNDARPADADGDEAQPREVNASASVRRRSDGAYATRPNGTRAR